MATGRIFRAWVDLRAGPTFGAVFAAELDPSRAVFVPRGVGTNARLADVTPIPPRKTLVLGAGGQLGRALREAYADAPHVDFANVPRSTSATSGN